MFSKTYTYLRASDCTPKVREAAQKKGKSIGENDVVFLLERLPPSEEQEHTSELLHESSVALQDCLANMISKQTRVSLIANYDFADVPAISRMYFQKDKELMKLMNLTGKFYYFCAYAEHHHSPMMRAITALMHFVPKSGNLFKSLEESFDATAKKLAKKE